MSAPDGIQRQDGRRFMRLLLDVEVEVTDPVAVRADLLALSQSADGSLGVAEHPEEAFRVAQVVLQAAAPAVNQVKGLRIVSASSLPRYLDESGDYYIEWTYPAMRARRDDGTLVED